MIVFQGMMSAKSGRIENCTIHDLLDSDLTWGEFRYYVTVFILFQDLHLVLEESFKLSTLLRSLIINFIRHFICKLL